MFKTVLKIFVILSACIHVLTLAQYIIGVNPNYAASVGPVFIPDAPLNYPVLNTFLPATSFSQSAAGSSASQTAFPNTVSASYSQSSVSGLPTAVGYNPFYAQDAFSSFPLANPFLPVTSLSQSSARSSASQAAFPNTVSASYSQSSVSAGTLPDPSVAAFTNSFAQAVASSSILSNFDFELPGFTASNLFRDLSNEIVLNEGLTDTSLPYSVAQGVGCLDSLTSTLYFDVVANTLGRFLLSRGLLTPEAATTLPQIFLNNVENVAIGSGINNADTIIRSFFYGFVNFINYLGLNLNDIASEVNQIFLDEITSYTK